MCIDRLPLVLVIQLKRFDYDWDKGIAIKFNDYFEFPRELDMRPYTVHGLVNHLPDSTQDQPDGDGLDDSHCESSQSAKSEEQSATHYTRYTLRGVVVHSGQASGGHYYSFIRQFCPKSRQYKWYKYDDSEVTLSSVDDEDEARLAWFGGDVNPSTCDSSKYLYVWDSKRIWNAYVLFYEREDFHPNMGCGSLKEFTVTQRLKRMVHLENMDYLHQQLQFHPLLALFIRNLIEASLDMCKMRPEVVEDLGLTTLKLLVNFSFAVRFQQVAREWYIWTPLFLRLMSLCPLVREKFVQWTIFSSPDRVCELLFECPYPEVRFLFAIAILYILSFDSSTACQSSVTCLKAFERARDRISSSDLPASTDRSDFAQAESAKTILSSIRCSKVSTKDGALCPSLSDIIVQVISLQLCASPANFLRRDFNNKITASDKLGDSTGWLTSPNEGSCGSSYTRTHTDVTHHPLVYRQFFSIFMDYACFGEDARARLLILGVPELLIKYALKNSLTSVSMSSWFTYSSISSAGIRNPEVLKRYLNDMLNSLPAHLDSTLPIALPPFPVVTASRDSLLLAFKSYQASGTSAYAIGSATSHSPVASSIQYSATVTLWCLLSLLVRSLDVSSHCTEQEKLVRISPCTASRSNIEAGHKSLALVDEADASVAQLDIPSVNPYQIGQAPLCPITSSLADLLLTTTCNRFISCFLRSWLSVSTVEHISNVLMFLSFKNLEFSSIAIDSLVWAFKTCRSDSGLVLSVLQSLLTVEDTFKIDRLRYALTGADGTGLMVPTPVTTCHQSFSHYTKVIKMVMGLILNDLQVQRLFQSEDSFIEWLHRWIETIGDSLQNPTSLSYWHSPGTRSPQSHDDFVLMMRRVYEVLPIPDDDQAGSSDESNGVSYDEDDGGQSSGSHYENSLDQVGFERLTRSWRRDTEETKFELQPPPTKHRISESANYVPDDTVDSDSLDRSP
ncbi:unnamed protein product [Dicrocoelium dendriticum]|nr:unnamed protein product [Dicrocoelium dendriticum]